MVDSFIVDIRPEPVREFRPIEGALAIPAEELRDRLDEIPRDKKVIIVCQKGFNSYTANRVLMQKGFENTYSLAGGLYILDEVEKDKKGLVCPIVLRPKKVDPELEGVIKLDLSGVQCPGPIMKLSETVKASEVGQEIEIITTDSGFAADIDGWCKATGNELLNVKKEGIRVIARVKKAEKAVAPAGGSGVALNGQTLVVFSNDLDKALAALIIANGARASGKDVTMFFTFWGINVLRKPEFRPQNKGLMDKMFGMMMPKGTGKLKLSKMNMGGMGTAMMRMVMKNKNVLSLDELIKQALDSGIKIIACTMAMDIMGIREEELIDGIEFGGVAKYIAESNNANSNLFI